MSWDDIRYVWHIYCCDYTKYKHDIPRVVLELSAVECFVIY